MISKISMIQSSRNQQHPYRHEDNDDLVFKDLSLHLLYQTFTDVFVDNELIERY